MAKRAFDFLLAAVLALPAALIIALAAIAVRIDSPGAPLFLQRRVGRNQRPFVLIKLRTMRHGTAHRASHEIGRSSITCVGALLRRTKIDELPQIWSVLTGEMSFVGPRPCLPNQVELVAEREKRGVFAVRPGITGPAQLASVDMSTPIRLAEIDAEYVRTATLKTDVQMIVRTALGGGRGDASRH